LKWTGGEGAITASLSPAKGTRADWWIDPMEVIEMARNMTGDILSSTAKEIVLAALADNKKGRVRGV
jgi:hypothetical protein